MYPMTLQYKIIYVFFVKKFWEFFEMRHNRSEAAKHNWKIQAVFENL